MVRFKLAAADCARVVTEMKSHSEKAVAEVPAWLGLVPVSVSWLIGGGLYLWVETRPPGTYDGQAGMMVTIYLLAGCLAWVGLGLPGICFAMISAGQGWRNRQWRTFALGLLGSLLGALNGAPIVWGIWHLLRASIFPS